MAGYTRSASDIHADADLCVATRKTRALPPAGSKCGYMRTAGEDSAAPDCAEYGRERRVVFGLSICA